MPTDPPYGLGYGDELSGELIEDWDGGQFDPGIPGTTVGPKWPLNDLSAPVLNPEEDHFDLERAWLEFYGSRFQHRSLDAPLEVPESGEPGTLHDVVASESELARDPADIYLMVEEEEEAMALVSQPGFDPVAYLVAHLKSRRHLWEAAKVIDFFERHRVRVCAAPDCDNVLADWTSHPKQARYCSTRCKHRHAQQRRRSGVIASPKVALRDRRTK